MRFALKGRILGAAALAATLAGCSTNAVIDNLPAAMGEPANAPVRPVSDTYQYPAVHDMPPPRQDTLLTDQQQVEMERQLENVRDRQEGHTDRKAAKKTAKPAQKQPTTANETQAAGTKTNP